MPMCKSTDGPQVALLRKESTGSVAYWQPKFLPNTVCEIIMLFQNARSPEAQFPKPFAILCPPSKEVSLKFKYQSQSKGEERT